MFPVCAAWMAHEPALTRVTFAPDTVQTAELVDEKLMGRPDVAVAATTNGADPNTLFGSALKAMVWLPWVTLKLWLTEGAVA